MAMQTPVRIFLKLVMRMKARKLLYVVHKQTQIDTNTHHQPQQHLLSRLAFSFAAKLGQILAEIKNIANKNHIIA